MTERIIKVKTTKRIDTIVEIIRKLSGSYSEYQVFCDWIQCSAIAIQNASCLIHDTLWETREKTYIEIIQKYPEGAFQKLFALLVEELGENMSDVLGHVYMAGGMGSKAVGQFFTPFHLSYLTAQAGMSSNIEELRNQKYIYVNEPSIGGGGMVIGLAKALHEHGIDYQRKLKVVGQDLDWKGVYMSYVQLSLLGIDAIIAQGDTLIEPYDAGFPVERFLRSPRNMGVLL